MSVVEAAGTDLHRIVASGKWPAAAGKVPIEWLGAIRERGAALASNLPIPDRKLEAWRYTPIGFLTKALYQPVLEGPFDAVQVSDVDELFLDGTDNIRLVFVNGYLATALCSNIVHADGVELRSLGGSMGEPSDELRDKLDQVADKRHVFAALNSALMSDGALIHVSANVTEKRPIELLHISLGLEQPPMCHPRHLIVLESGASAEVIERYCAIGDGAYFNNALIEVSLGAGSRLRHVRSQEESAKAQHLSDLHVRLGTESRYALTSVALGSAWSRTDIRVKFAGEGAHAELDGLILARDRQLNDVHLSVHHDVPNCTSRETFKGILDGKGKLVFDGYIHVAQDAQKTDAVLANDNLMLSRSAEVDTKPQLEIYADDVKCSHGTTVGELDQDMLFYLRSRGIPLARARQMLCQGFAEEVFGRIVGTPLYDRIRRLLAARLYETE